MRSRSSVSRRLTLRGASTLAGAALVVAALLSGCGGGDGGGAESLTVYVSLPLRGPSAVDGRDVADGARLALADAGGAAAGVEVRARYLDDTEGPARSAAWTPARAAADARTATEDSTAIAYLGEFDSGASRASVPITNEASLLQVSPASGAVDLVAPFPGSDDLPDAQPSGRRTFARVIPADDAQARAAAGWVRRLGVRRVATVSDGSRFGRDMVAVFEDTLAGAEITRRGAQLIFYGGEPDREPVAITRGFGGRLLTSDAELVPDAVEAQPDGTLATSAALAPSQLPPRGQQLSRRFEARYHRAPGRYAAYGYEAMAAILDAIDRASDAGDRASVVHAFFDTADRDSVVGRYSIDEVGDTTLARLTGYRIIGGHPVPAVGLSAR